MIDNSGTADMQVSYAYDAFGRLVGENQTAGEGTLIKEHYVYDGQEIVLVLADNGAVKERELYGPAVDQILALENPSGGKVYWMLSDRQDPNGDVVSDSGGTTTLEDHIDFGAYGNITGQTNSANQPRFPYAGEMLDPATGLNYLNGQWSDSQTGTLLSTGTGGGNTYAFANPTGAGGNYATQYFGYSNATGTFAIKYDPDEEDARRNRKATAKCLTSRSLRVHR